MGGDGGTYIIKALRVLMGTAALLLLSNQHFFATLKQNQ